jgi:hypothetical protein
MNDMEFSELEINEIDPFAQESNEDVDFEAGTAKEYSDLLLAFKKRANDEANKKAENTNTDFWFCAYFASKSHRDEFLEKIGALSDLIDQYIPGDILAERLGVELSSQEILIPKTFRVNKDVLLLSEDFEL